MKSQYKFLLAVLICGIMIAPSCKKSFFTDVNVNPNALAKVTPDLLLPTVEAALAYTQGGDMSRYSALLMQQMYGANSQSQQYYQYNFNPGNFDNVWPDYYTSTLENDYTLIQICDEGGYNKYGGIGRIIMAYGLQIGVDLWGDIPYSQAFKGNSATPNLHPTYDKAAGLYDTIVSLINVGTAQLQNPDGGALTPGAQDVIFKGNTAAWIKFGHAIKARLALHQSKGNAQMASTALAEIAQAFTGNADNAQYIFGTAQTSANSWYQFYRDRPGDENFTQSTLSANMLADHDPRYTAFNMDGTDPATGASTSYYNQINSPVELITYDELLFAWTLWRRTAVPALVSVTGNAIPRRLLYPQTEINFNEANVPANVTLYSPKLFWDH